MTAPRSRLAPVLILGAGAMFLVFTLVFGPESEDSSDVLLLLAGAGFTAVGALIGARTDGNRVGWVTSATGLALLGSGMIGIDRILSRTVSYTLVVRVLAAVYVGGVTWLTSLLPDQSQLVVAATTLTVATLFNPLRRRVQVWVDRRLNRSRYDMQRVMDGFAGSLRDQVDADAVVHGWVGVVRQTMQPAGVGVWVREGT